MVELSKSNQTTSFLQRLRSDTTGNTFAMAAAAMFPIAAVIGGGVDIGRAYMAKARLQQACDAGALAGRRSMTADTMSTADRQQAQRLFDFNFPEGTFGSANFQPDGALDNPRFIDGPLNEDGSASKTVDGFAKTTLPTTIMKIFGNKEMNIKVSCTSRLDVGNVDVMMVLDTTGSMSSSVTGGGTRIEALHGAVEEFYDILGPGGSTTGGQIRYGFVPYSSAVNVGELLYDENPDWLVGGSTGERWKYQTRRATWEILPPMGAAKSTTNVESFESYGSLDGMECLNNFGTDNEATFDDYFDPNPSGNPVISNSTTATELTRVTVTYSFYSWDGSTATPPSTATGSSFYRDCQRRVDTQTEVFDLPDPVTLDKWESGATQVTSWEYGQFTHDVYDYVRSIKTGTGAQRPTVDGLQLDTWDGCIEEAVSNNTITSSTSTVPADALDMNIDLIPYDEDSKWKPFWKEIMYERSSSTSGSTISTGGDSAQCPSESRRLAEYDSYGRNGDGSAEAGSLAEYVDAMEPRGFTNHTIGMIWGARMLSPDGIFSTANTTSTNGFKISRHMLFMTDGTMTIIDDNYDSYGLGTLDDRIGPAGSSSSELEDRQEARFALMCTAAKAKGYTVWVVQFGVSSVTSNMSSCATSPDHAKPATSKAALKLAFGDIAKTIGGLRLSQ